MIIALIAVVLIAIYVVGRIRGKNEGVLEIAGETAEQREDYLRSIGIQIDPTSSIAEVKVPEDFDERFAAYNAMLVTTGFDLTPLKGETVKKCVYTVTNMPEKSDNLAAVLLIHKGQVVAGHLLDVSTGMLYPLFETQSAEPAQETILPAEVAQEPAQDAEPVIVEGAYPVD